MFNHRSDFLRAYRARESKRKRWGVFRWPTANFFSGLLYFVFIFLIVGLLAVATSVLPHYATAKALIINGQAAYGGMLATVASLETGDFARAGALASQTRIALSATNDNWLNFRKVWLFYLPYLKAQQANVDDLLYIADKGVAAITTVSGLGQQYSDFISRNGQKKFSAWSESEKKQSFILLASFSGGLQGISNDIAAVKSKLLAINERPTLIMFDASIAKLNQSLPKIDRTVSNAADLLSLAPLFVGFPAEKTFLLIMQNNRELRPSGGFIGTYGIIKVKDGEIKELFTDDSYNLDRQAKDLKVEPPTQLQKYLTIKNWFMRDANWWPDWPTSAEKIKWFYEREGGQEKVDAVIGITPTLMEEILALTGEVKIGELTFNADNFWEQLEYQVEYGYYQQGIDKTARKDIIGELAAVLRQKIENYDLAQLAALYGVFDKAIKEKQALFYFVNPAAERQMVSAGWGGEVKKTESDYLMLVDANLAALKTDAEMERTLNYSVNQEKGQLIARAEAVYRHNGGFDWKTTRYRTYTRLYVPAGSVLQSVMVDGAPVDLEGIDVYNEFDKTAFGLFFDVAPGTIEKVVWQYRLPENIANRAKSGDYQFYFSKQPGVVDVRLNLDINIVGRRASYHDVLRKDEVYTLSGK